MKPQYTLSRDGMEIMRGSETEVLKYIHDHHSFSLDWACKYEGYSVTPSGYCDEKPFGAPIEKRMKRDREILFPM